MCGITLGMFCCWGWGWCCGGSVKELVQVGKPSFTHCALYFVLDMSKWLAVVRDNWIITTYICSEEISFSLL